LEQLVTIELFGQPYTFKAESDETNAKEVADYLVKEVTRVESQHLGRPSNVTKLATLILAAMNIASKNIELKKDHLDLLQSISEKSTNLIRKLDAEVNG
jgi:cell division protein ZapA (FtsZ GTPase activity inhibitor)